MGDEDAVKRYGARWEPNSAVGVLHMFQHVLTHVSTNVNQHYITIISDHVFNHGQFGFSAPRPSWWTTNLPALFRGGLELLKGPAVEQLLHQSPSIVQMP